MNTHRRLPNNHGHMALNIPDLRGSLTLAIIVICVTLYVAQAAMNLLGLVSYEMSYYYLGISRVGLSQGWLWQPFTSPFVHFGSMHLVFNMLILAFLGCDLENKLGRLQYLLISMICAMVGVLGFLALSEPFSTGVGYSAVIYGILAASAVLYPDRTIRIFLIFPIKMKWVMLVLGSIAFFTMIEPGSDGIAHSAHLAGALAGFVYIKLWQRSSLKNWNRIGKRFSWKKIRKKKRESGRRIPDKL